MAAFELIIAAAAILAEVACAPWTIDLTEARRQNFDVHGKKEENFRGKVANSDEEFNILYNNYNPNSKYDEINQKPSFGIGYDDDVAYAKDGEIEDEPDMGRYAGEYEYQSYMEKKVTKLVHNGSKYLEGLRRALEQYYLSLEECGRRKFTANSTSNQVNPSPLIPSNITNLPFTNPPSPDSPFNQNFTNSPAQILQNFTNSPLDNLTFEKCNNLTERSEQIRRVASLALHTTKMLQERVYVQKYGQHEEEEHDIEDRALIIRLAWFLDKLAELTGYDADVKEHLATTTQAPLTSNTPLPPAPSLSAVPEDIKLAMLECLKNKQNSTDPATVRCDFPVTYPAFMRQLFNVSDDPSSAQSNIVASITDAEYAEDAEADFSDLSEIHEHNLKEEFPPNIPPRVTAGKTDAPTKVTAVKRVQKRSLPHADPLVNIVNYYAKYKAWANVNPDTESGEVFPNDIHDGNGITKRSLEHYLKNPEDFQDVEFYVNHKEVLDNDKKIQEIPPPKKINKRSAHRIEYYKKKTMPRIPQDPMTKLDFYYKNKDGTDVNPDPVQAALVRAGLERMFLNGNIQTVRRYGANYNPAVPVQLVQGLAPGIVALFLT